MAKKSTEAATRNYHLMLMDGTERNVAGTTLSVSDGALVVDGVVGSARNTPVLLCAPGTWKMIEVERLDDK